MTPSMFDPPQEPEQNADAVRRCGSYMCRCCESWEAENSDLRLQVHNLKAALMAAGVPAGTVERIALIDGTGAAD